MTSTDVLARLYAAQARVVGAHQTVKAIARGTAAEVFVASDAEPRVVAPVLRAATERGIAVIEVESMAALGRACGIAVGATSAAVLVVSPGTL